MTTQCVQVKLEFGHSASTRKKPSPEGFTHDWCVYVRGSEGNEISHFVEKVVFNLHDSFPKPRRVVKEPPFKLEQSGYGGFTMPIEVYLKNREEPKKLQFAYDLFLHVEGEPPAEHCHTEKITFRGPIEDFRRKLLLSGGVGVLDDGGIPPGASYGIETMGSVNSSTENRTPSKGKPGSISASAPQKRLKTTAAPTKDPNKYNKHTKENKDTKTPSKDGKSGGKGQTKVASKRPPGSSSSEPLAKRKKEHSTKTTKTTSSEKSSSLSQDQLTKKTPGSSSKKKKTMSKGSLKSEKKKTDLFSPEIAIEHKPKAAAETVKKPTSLPPFEDEVSTGEMDEHPDSPSSKSTGSFSSLPRGGGAGGALETLMAEIADDYEDEEDQDYNIPFKPDVTKSSFQNLEDDSSSSSASFDEFLKQKMNKSSSNSAKPTEKVAKKENKIEKKSKVEAKVKSTEKKSSTKPKDSEPKGSKANENKKKTATTTNEKNKTKSKMYEKKEAKQVESKTKSSENKAKKAERPKTDPKKKAVDGKSKIPAEGRNKTETKLKNTDGKSKENVREIEKKGPIQTNNMDYLYELVDLHKRLMALKDREKLQKVVDLIGETGDFKITDKTFDFDLCSLDRPTVQKLKEYVPPL